MTILVHLITWLNAIANGLFGLLERPMMALPAWLSLAVISAMVGALMLMAFKATSNQKAIGKVRDGIKAQLLAMRLYRDNIPVVLKSQVRIVLYACLLLVHSIRPMAVMIIPFCLLLSQLGLWYQSRPLAVGEQAVVILQVADFEGDSMPPVSLQSADVATVTAGPVRVPSKRQFFWQIQANAAGHHDLNFEVAGQQVQKQLAIGEGLMQVSMTRPGLRFADVILHPVERPFAASSLVQSIRITYPDRPSRLTGTDAWVVSLLIISMGVAFLLKPLLNVAI